MYVASKEDEAITKKQLFSRTFVTLSVAVSLAVSLALAVTLQTFYYIGAAFPLIFVAYFMKEYCASAILLLPCYRDSKYQQDEDEQTEDNRTTPITQV